MAALITVTLLVLLVQDIPLSVQLHQVERDRIISSLEQDAFVLAGRSEESLEANTTTNHTLVTELARRYRAAGGARVVVTDAQGIALVTSDDDKSAVGSSYLSRPEIARALDGQIATGERFSDTLNEQLLYVAVPVLSGSRIFGAVRLTYPSQVVTDAVNARVRLLWLVALTTVLLAGIVGWIFSSTITRTLKKLRDTTEHLAEGRLHIRADETSGAPELRSLSRSFNIMASRLEALIEQQRTFSADASHQLRTPLTALRLRLERSRELVLTDPPGARERLVAAEAEADRLSDLIEGLLMLSRSEASEAALRTVDVAAVARERVEQWHSLGLESRVSIRYEGPATALALAMPTAAEQIIDNFIDNALAVSPADSHIVVRVVRSGGAIVIHVVDQGPGLSPQDAERAFDRFWRGSSEGSGSGLGLAIVAQLARSSGATATLTPGSDGGLDATVRFVESHGKLAPHPAPLA